MCGEELLIPPGVESQGRVVGWGRTVMGCLPYLLLKKGLAYARRRNEGEMRRRFCCVSAVQGKAGRAWVGGYWLVRLLLSSACASHSNQVC